PMEHFCGIIKPKVHSKLQLNTSLTNAVIIAEHHQDLLVGFTKSQHHSDINCRDYRICYQEPGRCQQGFDCYGGAIWHCTRTSELSWSIALTLQQRMR